MTKISVPCFALVLLFFVHDAFSQTLDWINSYGNVTNNVNITRVSADPDGHVYSLGRFQGTITFGSLSLTAGANANVYLLKTDSAGTEVWVKLIPNSWSAGTVHSDGQGNVYVSVSPGSGLGPATFLVYDDAGNLLSQQNYPSTHINSIDTDGQGGVYLAGRYSDTVDFGGLILPLSQTGNTNHGFVLKRDANGPVWAKEIYGTGFAAGLYYIDVISIGSDLQGNLFLSGESSADSLWVDNQFSDKQDSVEGFLIHIDPQGTGKWIKSGGGQNAAIPSRVAVSDAGRCYWGASLLTSSTTIDGNPYPLAPGSLNGIALMEYDTLGVLQNSLVDGETTGWAGSAPYLHLDASGSLFLSALFSVSITFGGNTYNGPAANYNTMLVKYDPGLSLIWGQPLLSTATNDYVFPSNPSTDAFGGVYLGGNFRGTMNINGTTLNSSSTAFISDAFQVRFQDPSFAFPPDSIWPGDANYDGVADNQDLLAVGLAFGNSGFTRPNASLTWVGQPGPDWNQSFSTGINYKHADTDGNGTINDDDTLAINLNYGLMHNRGDGINKTGPLITVEFESDSLGIGDTTNLIVNLGTSTLPATSLYGVAFNLIYDTTLIDPLSLQPSYTQSWLGNKSSNMLSLHRNFPLGGSIDLALTRKDQVSQNGFGELARIRIVMVDDLTAKTELYETLKVEVGNAYGVGRIRSGN